MNALCAAPSHERIKSVSPSLPITSQIFVYPIGIPALYTVVLLSHRSILRKEIEDRTPQEQEAVAHLAFLTEAYKPAYWLFVSRPHQRLTTPRVSSLHEFFEVIE